MGAGGWGSLLCHHGWVPMGREGGSSGPTPYGVSSTPTLRHLPHSHTPCARCLLILAGHRGHPGVQDPGQRHRQPLCAGRPRHATAAGGTGRESAGCWRPGWCWVPLPRPWQGWPGGYCPSHPHPTPARRPLNQCLPPSILHPTPPPPPPHTHAPAGLLRPGQHQHHHGPLRRPPLLQLAAVGAQQGNPAAATAGGGGR